jgi:ABC-2 type transport system permease protein
VSPVSWALLAMEGAIWRGWDFVDVLGPTAALVGLGVVCFALGARSFRYH